MEKASYRFLVVRDEDFPAIGMLRDWPGGNESALRHLEKTYPDWTQITIQKTDETAAKRGKQDRNQSSLRESVVGRQGISKHNESATGVAH